MHATLVTFQPRLWLLVLQFIVLFAPSHLYPVEDQENEAAYRTNSGLGQSRVPHIDARNRYERPTQLTYDPTLDILLNEVDEARHRSRSEPGSPETVPVSQSGFPAKCTGFTCLGVGDGAHSGDGNAFRFKRFESGGSGTLDKLGGANLIRKRFPQTGFKEVGVSKRGLFDGFFSTPKPSFESKISKQHPFGPNSEAGLFKEYNAPLYVNPPTVPPPSSTGSFGLGDIFNWGGKRDSGHLDRLGGANLVKRFVPENRFQQYGGNFNLVKERFRGKANFDPEMLYDFLKGTIVGQAGDSVNFGFVHGGAPYVEPSRVDTRLSDQSGTPSFEEDDYLEYLGESSLQRRGYSDAVGRSNPQNGRVLDPLGGQNLQKRKYLDALGGQNLQKRKYLDMLGGQNLQKKDILDPLGGQNLQKRRFLDALGGQNLQKRNHLDSLGGQNLQKRGFFDFFEGPNTPSYISNGTQAQAPSRNTIDEIIYVSHSAKRNSGNATAVPEGMSAVAKVEIVGEPERSGVENGGFKDNFSEAKEPPKVVENSGQMLDPLGGTNLIRNLNALESLKDSGREF